jgi:hypothetical protein
MNLNIEITKPFDKRGYFPADDSQGTVVLITFDSPCEEVLTIRLAKILNRGTEAVPEEAIWLIESNDTATRVVRLFHGNKSLRHFVFNCGFMDNNECVHTGKGQMGFGSLKYEESLPFIDDVLKVEGVRQGTNLRKEVRKYAGRCWFSAMCWALFFNKYLRELFIEKLPNDVGRLVETCLDDSEAAEKLRVYFSKEMNAGDEIGIPLEKEGRNGFTEATTIIAKLGIPLVRFMAPPTINFDRTHRAELKRIEDNIADRKQNIVKDTPVDDSKVSLMAVRCFRTNWRPKRRINYDGRRYYLASCMVGSEHCGHQIGLSTCDYDDKEPVFAGKERRKVPRITRWSVSDSDSISEGVGPLYWKIKKEKNESRTEFSKRWWKSWGDVIPVTVFRNQTTLCDLSSHNRPTGELQCKLNKTKNSDLRPGVVNSDFIYISMPHHKKE